MPVFQMNSGSEVTSGEITEAPLNRMKPEPKGNDNLCQVQSCMKVQCPMSKVQRPRIDLDLGPGSFDFGHWTLDFGLWTLDFGQSYPLSTISHQRCPIVICA